MTTGHTVVLSKERMRYINKKNLGAKVIVIHLFQNQKYPIVPIVSYNPQDQ